MLDIKKVMHDRDLSWVDFNNRVIYEAKVGRNPLLERTMFLAIASVNLDQFFMVRIPKKRKKEQKTKIHEAIKQSIKMMYKEYDDCMKDLKSELGIEIFDDYKKMDKKEQDVADDYFKRLVEPLLEIIEIDPFHPIPRVASGNIVIVGDIEKKDSKEKKTIMVQLRGQTVRLIKVNDKKDKYILSEALIKEKLEGPLSDFKIKDIGIFRLTRDEDMEIGENSKINSDLLKELEYQIEERSWGEVIRITYDEDVSKEMKDFIKKNFCVDTTEVYEVSGPINLDYLWTIEGLSGYDEKYKYKPLVERFFKKMKGSKIFDTLKKEDRILLHPFESFETVTEMIDTAADDPDVVAIKQTLYRVKHHDSPIISALEKACKNGKQVTVLVEAKARFDESDNIEWAKKLDKVGCTIVYGIKDIKVHGKALLIMRKEGDKIKKYVQLGTGNYYKAPYVDMSLFTANVDICEDISNLFTNLMSPQVKEKWKMVSVGPHGVEDKFRELVEREIKHAKDGKKAKITAKMNGLTDPGMIERLYEASKVGVKVTLIVRGPSCIMPGIKDLSENIKVYSIIGRFLEHNRVFIFENNGDKDYYLSSADWMTRNLERRVELLFPITHEKNRKQLDTYFKNILEDNVKRWEQNGDGTYSLIKKEKDEKEFNYQDFYLDNKF